MLQPRDESTTALVDTLRRHLRGHAGVRLALLFGSRARGAFQSTSDVDLAVDGEALDLPELMGDLSLATGLDVQIVLLRQVGFPLLQALLREAILVHEGDPHAEAEWTTRAILEVETDRLWYERMRDAYLAKLAASPRG